MRRPLREVQGRGKVKREPLPGKSTRLLPESVGCTFARPLFRLKLTDIGSLLFGQTGKLPA